MQQSTWLYPITFFILQLQHQFSYSSSSLSSTATNHLCPNDQSLALLQFKLNFTIDSYGSKDCDYNGQSPYPKTMSWNSSTDCCRWDGVWCDAGQVTGLDLSCSRLQGVIHSNSTLFQLSQLQRLNLAYNDFSLSRISLDFGGFASLTHLNLSNSKFSGQIPSEILHLSKLVSLDLSGNNHLILEHHIFHALLVNLTQLREVSLSFVNISSVVPMNLSSSLTFLFLSETGLQGKLPDILFHLPNLQTLNLSGNIGLNGYLPKVNGSNSSPLKRLDLSTTSLLGEVPNSIGYLKYLNYLQLSRCKFSGSIPESLGNLTLVTVLDLSLNKFSGKVPSALLNLKQLTRLNFSFNRLEGHIPNVFAKLSHLSSLSLRDNKFNGPFPSSVTNLTQLASLDLSSNSLTGPFPSTIVGLQNLTHLMLFNNSLSGTIPSWLFALPSLLFLDLHSNRLTGSIEEFRYRSLKFIDLSSNELQGPIPLSIFELVNLNALYLYGNNLSGDVELDMFSNLINLQYLDLSYNSLSVRTTATNNINATIPNNLIWLRLASCKMKEFPDLLKANEVLDLLDLSYNQIHGQFPNWAGTKWRDSLSCVNLSYNFITGLEQLSWKNVVMLDLHSNLLQGTFPSSICNLSSLEILDLSNNSLGGVIPQCLETFSSKLTVLDMRMNGLQGTIPTFAKGNMLRNLNLHANQLQGMMPKSLANCKYLEVLDFGNNQINDTFPQWLETLPELQVLVLSSNRFHGPISSTSKTKRPFSKLRILDLSHNEFSGVLPTKYFENFKAMINVDENRMERKYMGEGNNHGYYDYVTVVTKGLPRELERIQTIFTTIDLSRNKFEGEIPKSIGNLILLRVLNLYQNSLIGYIPSSLGNLSVLESLDLSSNQLVGEIPQQLTGLTFLAFLNLSQNHLVGRIPQGNQFNTFENDSYSENPTLCGIPLSKNCGDNETPQPPPAFQQEDDLYFASGFTWKVVAIGYGCGTGLGLVMGCLMFLTRKPKWFTGLVENQQPKKVKR